MSPLVLRSLPTSTAPAPAAPAADDAPASNNFSQAVDAALTTPAQTASLPAANLNATALVMIDPSVAGAAPAPVLPEAPTLATGADLLAPVAVPATPEALPAPSPQSPTLPGAVVAAPPAAPEPVADGLPTDMPIAAELPLPPETLPKPASDPARPASRRPAARQGSAEPADPAASIPAATAVPTLLAPPPLAPTPVAKFQPDEAAPSDTTATAATGVANIAAHHAAPPADMPAVGSPSPSFAEKLAVAVPAHPTPPIGLPVAAAVHTATVAARPGQIGREMGVEIARTVSQGNSQLTIRLDPIEMGKIEVKLSFDDRGSLRAVVAAESPAALELLRRDTADLTRALTDAGVRSDAQSFRFDSRAGSGEGGRFWQRQQNGDGQQNQSGRGYAGGATTTEEPIYRSLRTSGRVDLMA